MIVPIEAAVNGGPSNTKTERRSAALKTDSARPTAGLFAKPAKEIADSLASKEVSPQGAASGMRLLTFYINYSAKRLSASKLRNLEKARKLLAARLDQELREKSAA
jgi:Protein of unknown function (DUF3175)